MSRKPRPEATTENNQTSSEKEKPPYFAVSYRLDINKAQVKQLDKEFYIARRYQVALIKKMQRALNNLRSDANFVRIQKEGESSSARKRSEYKQEKEALLKKHGFDKSTLMTRIDAFGKEYRKIHGRRLNSIIERNISERVIASLIDFLWYKGEDIHIPKALLSIKDGDGASTGNTKAIVYNKSSNSVRFRKSHYNLIKKEKMNRFQIDSLAYPIANTSFKRIKDKKGIYQYYLSIVFKGIPPKKYTVNENTGEVFYKHHRGEGAVGVDLGVSTVAVVNQHHDIIFEEYGHNIKKIGDQIAELQRKMERQKRAANPNNFNKEGTKPRISYEVVNGKKKRVKLKWKFSKNYIKNRNKAAWLMKKRATALKQYQESLANRVLAMGDDIRVETMNYDALKRRAKKTQTSKSTGKFKKKKRFGKSIQLHAPAQFVSILERKLKYSKQTLMKVDNYSIRASQYNHITDGLSRKELKDRYTYLDKEENILVQRDLYSAFLLLNCKDVKTIDREQCLRSFNRFRGYHDDAVDRLMHQKYTGKYIPSSMGV